MPCKTTQDGQVIVKSCNKTWSTGVGNDNALQYSYLRTTWTVLKGKKDMILKVEPPRLESVKYATGEDQRAATNSSRKNEAKAETLSCGCVLW